MAWLAALAVLRLRTGGNKLHHALAIGLGNDPRRVLRVDKHHIGPARLQSPQAFMQLRHMRRQGTLAQHRVRAHLPEHQVGMLGEHRTVQSLEHVGDFLAVHTTVQQRELLSRKTPGELLREAIGIGACR
jgi:hypothetical protein